jgi:cytochrome P450
VATTQKYDLYSSVFRARAYETFARMREEDPVHRQTGLVDETPTWFVTRYEDAVAVLLDDDRFRVGVRPVRTPEELEAARVPNDPVLQLVDNHMLNTDGDDHRRLRRLVTKAFTPRMVEALRPRIEEIADELLDAVQTRRRMELVDDYAFPLPITVIAELLGIPAEDRARFRAWSNAAVTPSRGPEGLERFLAEMRDFTAYLRGLLAERRTNPRDDLLSALLHAEEAGDALSEPELFSMLFLLIIAGHETTVGLIGNAVLALLLHPEHLAALREDPDRIPEAVEELLRYQGPVERAMTRWAAEDVELAGRLIRRGEAVIVVLGAADRDPARFADPDAIVFGREDNRHVAFGRGPHYCLGAPLARVEGEIAIRRLLARMPGLRLAIPPDELSWRPVPVFRSLVSLPVAWD